MSNFNLKIKTIIIGLVIVLVVTVSSIFIYYQYLQNNVLAYYKIQQKFDQTIKETLSTLKYYDSSSVGFLKIVKNIEGLDLQRNQKKVLMPIITDFMTHEKHIYAIYLGWGKNQFYIIYNLSLSQRMSQALQAPSNAIWLVKQHKVINGETIAHKQFLDKNLNLIKDVQSSTSFVINSRPWYQKAIKTDKVIKTSPYVFDAISQPGITYAKTMNTEQKLVLSIDITLHSLQHILNKQELIPGSSIFLHDKKGNVIVAKDTMHSKPIQNIKEKILELKPDNQNRIYYNNKEYFIHTEKLISDESINTYISFLIPYKSIMMPIKHEALHSLVSLIVIILLVLTPFIVYSIRVIVRPILQLQSQSQKVEEGKFDTIKQVDSFMLEVKQLSQSFVSMSTSLKEQRENNDNLIHIAYALSTEKDYDVILETILRGVKDIVGADGGTLYLYNKEKACLDFKIAMNSSLDIYMGASNSNLNWKSIPLYENNEINNKNISVVCAMSEEIIILNDVYNNNDYDFFGVKQFDSQYKYNTKSMLVVPIKDRDDELIAVLQLVNKTKENVPSYFNENDKFLAQSMAELSAMTLHNNKLVMDLENLLYALIESIGTALGEKSIYTKKHVNNVAELCMQIAHKINDDTSIYNEVKFSRDELEELKLAAWLHDIGKITTPEHIIDKSTRLETLYDRIHTIRAKIEILKRDIKIDYLEGKIVQTVYESRLKELDGDFEFLEIINTGDVFMDERHKNHLYDIHAKYHILINGKKCGILTDDEFNNLSIKKGTLTNNERDIINNHVHVSYKMLQSLPFPKKFKNVAKIAGSHHKTVDGKGYAHEDILDLEMTLTEKILALADVFDALSAHDRPYRKANNLSQIENILRNMCEQKHLDEKLVKFFLEQKVYTKFVKENLLKVQLD